MRRTIAVFPGQGAQAVGMGRSLNEGYEAARRVFEAVDDALGESLSRLMFEGPADDLMLTANAQPALMACALAAVRAVEAEAGVALPEVTEWAAGHSLGEYAALTAMNALDLADAARLLRLRGEAMQAAVPVGEGAMAAVLGGEAETIEAVAAEASTPNAPCEVANDNGEGQMVLSGARDAVERAMALLKAKGLKRVILLPVSAPFHSSLMAPAAERLGEALATVRILRPKRPIVANVTAAPEDDPETLRRLLQEQVCARVRWRESMVRMKALGVERLIEFGHGRVLTGLAKRALPGAGLVNVQTADDVKALAGALAA
ncbi:MAG: ACP S-malonyltransferase [Geminicoccaceae bacterium]|nr:ACP S-malonyltransferase [Geminicoccaceae bacterium]